MWSFPLFTQQNMFKAKLLREEVIRIGGLRSTIKKVANQRNQSGLICNNMMGRW